MFQHYKTTYLMLGIFFHSAVQKPDKQYKFYAIIYLCIFFTFESVYLNQRILSTIPIMK